MKRHSILTCSIACSIAALAVAGCAAPAASAEPPVDTQDELTVAALKQTIEELKQVGELADKYGGYFSKAKAGLDAAKFILQTLDIVTFKSDEQKHFEALTQQITNLGSAFTWYDNALSQDQSWRALNSDLASALQQIEQNQQNPNDPNFPKFTTASAAYVDSAEFTAQLESNLHFLRYWDASAYAQIPSAEGQSGANWRNFIALPAGEPFLGSTMSGMSGPSASKSFVYDWRLGVPAMMMAIATRVQIIALADPGFTLSTTRSELASHRDALLHHYNQMWNGVQCYTAMTAPNSQFPSGLAQVICADTHTGNWRQETFFPGDQNGDEHACQICVPNGSGGLDCSQRNPQCINAVDAKYQAVANDLAAKQDELRNAVLDDMPFYQMRSLIDTLGLYLSQKQDLTAIEQRIPTVGAQICVDTQNGNPAAGTPIWTYPCTGNEAQWWQYDRTTEHIVNPAYHRCLDALPQPSSSILGGQGQLRPAELMVQLSDCSDAARSQRWSYDPDGERLYNGGASTGILVGPPVPQTLAVVDREINCPPLSFCGNHSGEFWFASQAAHGLCQPGGPLANDADQSPGCASSIGAADPFCAESGWDSICVSEVGSICGQSCGNTQNAF